MKQLKVGEDYVLFTAAFDINNNVLYYSVVMYANLRDRLLNAFYLPDDMLLAPVTNVPLEAVGIVNRHLRGDRDILACQDELIEAGYAEWARL